MITESETTGANNSETRSDSTLSYRESNQEDGESTAGSSAGDTHNGDDASSGETAAGGHGSGDVPKQ